MIKSKHDIVILLEEIGVYTTSDRIGDFVSYFTDLEQKHGMDKLKHVIKIFCANEGEKLAFLKAVYGNPFFGRILDEFKTALNFYDPTARVQKLEKALKWLINLYENAINASDKSYCGEFCPVRDKQTDFCPAEYVVEHFNPDFDTYERDYQKCMELQVEYYTENAK